MILNKEHLAIRETVSAFIEKEINPHTDKWEQEGIFPAHDLFKKMGDLGLLGISKPTEFGGMGLDYSYQVVFSEELGKISSGGVSMAIGVQTDMATPALAKYGNDQLRQDFLAPAISIRKLPGRLLILEPALLLNLLTAPITALTEHLTCHFLAALLKLALRLFFLIVRN